MTERRTIDEEGVVAMLQMKDDIGQLKAMVGTLVKAQELEDADHKNIGDRLAKIESRMSTVPDDVHHEHHDFWTVYIEEIKTRRERNEEIKRALISKGIWSALLLALGWFGWKHGGG